MSEEKKRVEKIELPAKYIKKLNELVREIETLNDSTLLYDKEKLTDRLIFLRGYVGVLDDLIPGGKP